MRERETEVREVIENYNNMERECLAAKQSVAGELRDALHALRLHWDQLQAQLSDTTPRYVHTTVTMIRIRA